MSEAHSQGLHSDPRSRQSEAGDLSQDVNPFADVPKALPEESRKKRRAVARRLLAQSVREGRHPLEILNRQNSTRVQDLVPLRSERMSASPFAFYRGTAAIMAADQSNDPHSGILVASCGDAHLSNFGFYASPQRTLLFDLNDFDESAWAPWEWDLKRLVTSVIIGARATDRDEATVEQAARDTVTAYTTALHYAVTQSPLERYYSHFDPFAVSHNLDKPSRRALAEATSDAQKRTGERAVRRLTEAGVDGTRRFVERDPVMTHVDDSLRSRVDEIFQEYRRTASVDIGLLLSQYRVDDVARRVVGVGSVGTRCYVALLSEPGGGTLILQVKEAVPSVLKEPGHIPQPAVLGEGVARSGEGRRVVALQRCLQAYSDPFLGHLQTPAGDFYVRQFHDMKGSVEVEALDDVPFRRYAVACGVVLARAHSQSPNAAEVDAYIGKGRKVVDSIVAWSDAYADLSLADYKQFVATLEGH